MAMEPQDDIKLLLEKYKAGTISEQERAVLDKWYLHVVADGSGEMDERRLLETFDQVLANLDSSAEESSVRRIWPRIAAAASILLVLGAGAYLALRKDRAPVQVAQMQKVDILPGNQSAILQLSNGEQIALNTVKTGTIATQGQTTITKTNNQLVYQGNTQELIYNTVTTKRGNFYQMTLSDGTVAILDAGSSIRYPVAFVGKERRVEITGQVYFEVKHNAKMPFRVSVKGQMIEDIGTAFNVNAYDDEPAIKTTLIEGSIKIQNKTLTPGQQAVISNGRLAIAEADTEQAIAWKNGLFNFEGQHISEVMRQISRWYDVDVEYPEGVPNITFGGKLHRDIKASGVINMLKFFKVKIEIVQGSGEKKILVKP